MCHLASARLSGSIVSVPEARSFVSGTCRTWGLQDVRTLEILELLSSELVTNAVLHTNTPVEVLVAAREGHVEVSVADEDPRLPVTRPPPADFDAALGEPPAGAEPPPAAGTGNGYRPRGPRPEGDPPSLTAGRGLIIVDQLSDAWGVRPLESGGKAVWFRLLGGVAHTSATCVCATWQGDPTGPAGSPVWMCQTP
jgi:anti-sigma regulatory factor (Ser/Thr protein kinase)